MPRSGLPLPQELQLRVQAQERVFFLNSEKASRTHPVELGRLMPVRHRKAHLGTRKRNRMRDTPPPNSDSGGRVGSQVPKVAQNRAIQPSHAVGDLDKAGNMTAMHLPLAHVCSGMEHWEGGG